MSFDSLPLILQKLSSNTSEIAQPSESDSTLQFSDNDLMQRVQHGDHDAFEKLFDRYHGIVRGIARKVLKHPEDVADVVQEVFLDTYQNCGTFDPSKGTVRTWICCVAHHRSVKKWRNIRSRDWQSEDAENVPTLPDMEVTPNQWIRSIDFRRCLDTVLGNLNEKQRKTMMAYFFEGRDLDVIAAELGDSLANTRHHLYRGLAGLRRELVQNRLLEGYTEYDSQEGSS
jgi:RNA polymerase sigma-70 factor (ECF subfamily)